MRTTIVSALSITLVITLSVLGLMLSTLAPSRPAHAQGPLRHEIPPPVRPAEATVHQEWVARCIAEMQTVRVGMTRAQLLRVFLPEGGLPYYRTRQQLYYHGCPYFKVRVTFQPVGKDTGYNGNRNDKIVSISEPFLERQLMPY